MINRSPATFALAATLALGFLTGCGETTGADTSSTSNTKYDGTAWIAKVRKAAVTNNGGPIKRGCHLPAYTWQCFFDGLASPYAGRLDVKLSTPGDVTSHEAKDMSKKARQWWFNMAGLDIKGLNTVVTTVNGVDSGTTRRTDMPMLN